jgi:phosphoglycerol transferase MdoB-like AlkP superfamily enzyme
MLFRLSPRISLFLSLAAVFFLAFVASRVAFYFYFLHGDVDESTSSLWQAFFIGVRFDLRIAFLAALPPILLSVLPGRLSLRRGRWTGRLAIALIILTAVGTTFFYIVDFAHYSYLAERVNTSVLRFLQDQEDSLRMVWESYPVVPLLLMLITVGALSGWWGKRLVERYQQRPPVQRGRLSATLIVIVWVFIWLHGIMGKVGSTVPLRWSDAFFANDEKVAALGLNPMVYFFDSVSYQTRSWDEELLGQHYARVADWLGVDEADSESFSFARHVPGKDIGRPPPNVVFIHLESLGANRMGLFGNPLDATPNLDQFGRDGLFFPNFMVPSSGTARTVFGLVTGIPDVSWGGGTASRNPQLVNQYTLVNAFKGYKKLYFLGGSAGWANVKGILTNNIHNLELWEEGDYEAPEIDVWGISDRSLFQAAHQRINELDGEQPFVAFIQTAGNHRPFTIPDDDSAFKVKDISDETVQQHSFLGADQYNAVRLLDYNVGYYINSLVKGSWYEGNTIYVMYGDHNDRSESSSHMGYSEALGLYKHHVPLIIYGPGVIDEPRVMQAPASLVDLLPTSLGIAGLPYTNRTLGRDLLDWNKPGYALTFGGNRTSRPTIGLLGNEYHLSMFHNGKKVRLFPLENPSFENEVSDEKPDITADRKAMLEGLYQAARYMMFHNRRGHAENGE